MRTLVNDDGVLVSDLWIDQPSALQDLRGRASAANITDEQANAAADVITRGYGVIDLDLRPSIFEQIETEVEQIWAARPSDVAYGGSVDSVTGDFAFSDVPASYSRSNPQTYRFCCAHTHSRGLEELFFNKKLHQQISFLFGEPAIAVQTLYFEYGSRQGQHRDTSVVSFNPLSHLLAAWIALEDIEEGTGELEYFPGSHRVENFFYPDGSIIWRDEYGPNSFEQMDAGIRETAARHQLAPERFLAKRSQALIWHHSLSHGGGPVTKADKTRKSLVIHFTTLSQFTRRYHQLIYKDPVTGDYCSFVDSSPEVIERDGCYGSGSVIRNWRDRPALPAKRLKVTGGDDLAEFTGHASGRFKQVDHLAGWLDRAVAEDDHGGIVLVGWAMNLIGNRPVANIVLVDRNSVVAAWPTSLLRPDVAEAHGSPSAAYVGYYKVLPRGSFDGRTQLRLYAVDDDGSFAELNYSDAASEFLRQLEEPSPSNVE